MGKELHAGTIKPKSRFDGSGLCCPFHWILKGNEDTGNEIGVLSASRQMTDLASKQRLQRRVLLAIFM